MESRISSLRDKAQARGYNQYRTYTWGNFCEEYQEKFHNFSRKNANIVKFMCQAECPLVFTGEKIAFTRTKKNIPPYYTSKHINDEFGHMKDMKHITYHNVTPNYKKLLEEGLEKSLLIAQNSIKNSDSDEKKDFYEDVVTSITAVLELADRYSRASLEAGNIETSKLLKRVPRFAATTLHEALQSVRFASACFYFAEAHLIGFGRMDQYFWPYYEKDINEGRITREDAYNLFAEFFISLNKDTDLYPGIQLGDNGQTIMLGGCKKDGTSAVNDLTYLILEVSRDLKLIDPKINLRIDSTTPLELLKLGCELTAVGLGFPQYSNDEVVIPALVKKGYTLEDARDYTVAACWEFIIPGKGFDMVNQGAVSFPYAVDYSFSYLMDNKKFTIENFENEIKKSIYKQVKDLLDKRSVHILPSPYLSIFFDGALEQGIDGYLAAKYRNIGIHGAGVSNAADAYNVIKYIYNHEGIDGLNSLLKHKKNNFSDEEYHDYICENIPKVGNDNDDADGALSFLFDAFADVADELSTDALKIRAGSGSAMYYIWLADDTPKDWLLEPVVGATADGKRNGEPLSASLGPSHGIKVNGVVSVLKSFSKIDYSRIMNGGPITIELTPSVFSSEQGLEKLAQLIKYFVKLGNQQLQLNVLDVATLEDAIINPQNHRNLVVRVWGWSGYFCELAPEYQQHIIHRHKYSFS